MEAHILSRDIDSNATNYSLIAADTQVELIKIINEIYGNIASRILVEIKFTHIPEVLISDKKLIVPKH